MVRAKVFYVRNSLELSTLLEEHTKEQFVHQCNHINIPNAIMYDRWRSWERVDEIWA